MVGEIIETDRGMAKVVGVEYGRPVIEFVPQPAGQETLPGMSDADQIGQRAFMLATEFETADN